MKYYYCCLLYKNITTNKQFNSFFKSPQQVPKKIFLLWQNASTRPTLNTAKDCCEVKMNRLRNLAPLTDSFLHQSDLEFGFFFGFLSAWFSSTIANGRGNMQFSNWWVLAGIWKFASAWRKKCFFFEIHAFNYLIDLMLYSRSTPFEYLYALSLHKFNKSSWKGAFAMDSEKVESAFILQY